MHKVQIIEKEKNEEENVFKDRQKNLIMKSNIFKMKKL
jgi:hypothetical protein